jgi:hypothetical protein
LTVVMVSPVQNFSHPSLHERPAVRWGVRSCKIFCTWGEPSAVEASTAVPQRTPTG